MQQLSNRSRHNDLWKVPPESTIFANFPKIMKNNFESILFEKYWHLACHKNELKNNNDYVRFNTQFGDVTIFNDYGELIAFDNLCAHRGASIFLKNYGNNEFKCPYHNWIYKKGKIFIPKKTSYILKEEPQINRYELLLW